MDDLEFRAIQLSNLDEVVDLEVTPEQEDLVADNAYSIAQALLDPVGQCSAAYFQGRAVGFVYTRLFNEGRHLYICRFMVDQREQRRGLGRRIMARLLANALASGRVEVVDLAVSREAGSAEGFYTKCGFVATDEPYRGGWRMVLAPPERR